MKKLNFYYLEKQERLEYENFIMKAMENFSCPNMKISNFLSQIQYCTSTYYNEDVWLEFEDTDKTGIGNNNQFKIYRIQGDKVVIMTTVHITDDMYGRYIFWMGDNNKNSLKFDKKRGGLCQPIYYPITGEWIQP